jgi:hypothetical protein
MHQTPALRIVLHGFFLISLNLFALMSAVIIMIIGGIQQGEWLRSVLALSVDLGIYILVFKVMAGIEKSLMQIDDFNMFAFILIASLALFPTIYYPMQYMIKGEWVNFNQILEIWPFQLIVNGLCLIVNYFFIDWKSRQL